MVWLDGWNYRKSVTITAPDSNQTNYQLKCYVYRSTGTDSGEKVYISTRCEEDYDDIRFTDENCSIQFDYWIQESTTDSATIWVEIPTIPTSTGTTIYLYYGNASATALSNGDNTFLQYYGATTALDAANTIVTPLRYIASLSTDDGNLTAAGVYRAAGHNALIGSVADNYQTISLYNIDDGSSDIQQSGKQFAAGVIYITEIYLLGTNAKFYKNGVLDKNTTTDAVPSSNYAMGLYLSGGNQDWSFLAKYTSTPPTFSTWGLQEGINTTIIGKYTIEFTPTNGEMVGKYTTFQSQNIIGKYNIFLSKEVISKYNIHLSQNTIGKYTLIPKHGSYNKNLRTIIGGWAQYTIEILDPILSEGQFNNLKIRRRLGQIHTCELDVINPSADIIAQLIYNAPIRIRINGRLLFTGVLKRIDKDDNIPIYHIYCEGAGCILRDINITDTKTYGHTGSYYIINDLLLPATNWYNFTSNWNYIDYVITPGQALNHIQNICKTDGLEWNVKQQQTYRHITTYVATASTLTVDGDTITNDYYAGRFGCYDNGSSANTGFTITTNTANVLTVSTIPTTVATGDAVTLWGKYIFDADVPNTTSATVEHYVINKNACKLNRKKNVDKIITSVIGVGQNPETARMVSWATACTFNYATLNISESCLTYPASSAATWFYIANTTDYASNGTVMVGDEKITYTNKSATGIGPCTRGYDSTATQHYVGDDVLNVNSLTFTAIPTTFPDAGSFWLGTELIDYTTKDSTKFYNLTRGASSSNKYRHGKNIHAFDFQYTDTTPESLTPVGLYGLQKRVISVIGATIRDAIDRRVQQELFTNDDLTEYGDFTLLSADFWKDIDLDDRIKFTDKGETDNYWRIIGTDHEQYKPVVIYFGQPDDYILEDVAQIPVISDSAREKNERAQLATIVQLSSDNKSALVQYTDGSSEWITLV